MRTVAGHPTIEIGDPDRFFRQRRHRVGIEHTRQIVIDAAQDRFGQAAGLQRHGKTFLQERIVIQPQPSANLGEEGDDVLHRGVHEIAQLDRIAQHQVVDVQSRVRSAKARAAPAAVFNGIVARLDNPPAGYDRDGIELGHVCAFLC